MTNKNPALWQQLTAGRRSHPLGWASSLRLAGMSLVATEESLGRTDVLTSPDAASGLRTGLQNGISAGDQASLSRTSSSSIARSIRALTSFCIGSARNS